jgi:ATP-dependent DNA helicase DinG
VKPASASTPSLREVVAAAFSQSGALARAVDGYEPREGQRAMAEAVASVLDSGGTLLVEAGTGTGKTLAYLIPAILSRNRVLVSTGTKNLQEQIFFKDLPALREALGMPFTATLMKGRSNYLCLHRFEQYRMDARDPFVLPLIDEWSKHTETGDRAELSDLPEDLPAWKDIAADAETCLGGECPRYGDCFVTRMRQRAAESDVVIVNHHLLCADASVRQSAYGEVIPHCPTLVVDEAHQLEEVATQFFGVAISNYRVDDLVRDAERRSRMSSRARALFSQGSRSHPDVKTVPDTPPNQSRIMSRRACHSAGRSRSLGRQSRGSSASSRRVPPTQDKPTPERSSSITRPPRRSSDAAAS